MVPNLAVVVFALELHSGLSDESLLDLVLAHMSHEGLLPGTIVDALQNSSSKPLLLVVDVALDAH